MLLAKRIEDGCHRQPKEITAMTSLGKSFFDPDWWPKPLRAFLSAAKDEVREMIIAEDEGKNWKSGGDGDEEIQSESEILNM